MTQQEKQLLLKDLCARLPYGVQIHIDFNGNGHIVGDATLNTITSITGQFFNFTDFKQDFKNGDCCPISGFGSNKYLRLEEFKPYLRPMSSMTGEEEKVFNDFLEFQAEYVSDADLYNKTDMYDWLLANHFDYRIDPSTGKTLIESGLALEAPEGMYKDR